MSIIPLLVDDDSNGYGNDDETSLLRLTKPSEEETREEDGRPLLLQSPSPSKQASQALTLNHFQDLSSRFTDDITSPICIESHEQFWKSLIALAQSFGFTYNESRTNSTSTTTSTTTTSSTQKNTSIDFDSDAGKSHVDAVTSLLGVSNSYAKELTINVINRIERTERMADSKQTTSTSPSTSTSTTLLGTKKLLLLVRNYHYEQQISRIRFIAESLRREQADDEKKHVQESCKHFLDGLDQSTAFTSIGSGSGVSSVSSARGLLKVLLCIACAPVTSLGRDKLYKSVALLGDGNEEYNDNSNDNSNSNNDMYDKQTQKSSNSIFNRSKNTSNMDTTSTTFQNQGSKMSQHLFAKKVMEQHEEHYGSSLRTEALEAMFMLLYTRIQGGINRSDYLLLLLAFDQQKFYSYHGQNQQQQQQSKNINMNDISTKGMKRRSQLTTLILAECMSLWHATNNNRMSDSNTNDEWIGSHPFLCGNDANSIFDELNLIGKLLLEKYAHQVLVRRQQLASLQPNVMADGQPMDIGDAIGDDMEAPESIAILTFGLLLKMAHNSSPTSTTTSVTAWASQPSMKELSGQCISIANDECGAFEYLGNVMTSFLPELPHSNGIKKKHREYIDNDWREDIVIQSNESDGPLRIANGDMGHDNDVLEEEDGAIISYASIGREILVGTLCAFRSTICASNKDNVITLCKLASKIYRNNDAMCSQFWSDWVSESEARDSNGGGDLTDPMCLLLDAAYQIANNAITEEVDPSDNLSLTSMNCGRFAASILPRLQPLLSFISSLIPRDGGTLRQILEAFLSNGIIYASLIGCLHLCSTEESSMTTYETSAEHQNVLEVARMIMSSLSKISSLIQEGDSDSAVFLRAVLTPVSRGGNDTSWNGNGAQLLHKIATSAQHKLLHKVEASSRRGLDLDIQLFASIASSSIQIITSLLQYKTTDDLIWIDDVAKCVTGKTGSINSFVNSGMKEVTSSCMKLLYTLSCNATTVVMAKTTPHETALNYLDVLRNGVMVACETISSSKFSLDLENRKLTTICYCIWILQTLLKSFDGIVLTHKDEDIRNSAKLIRDWMIEHLASSTALGTAIGSFATKPVSSALIQMVNKKGTSSFRSESKNEISNEGYYAMLKTVPYPDQSESPKVGFLDLSAASLSLLVTWGEVSERIVITNNTLSNSEMSLEEVAGTLPTEQLKVLSSELASLGPSRLLLSLAEPPYPLNESMAAQWQEGDTTVLTMISRFAGWSAESKSDRANELAVKALKLIMISLGHSNIIAVQKQRVIETILGRESAKYVGSQLNLALGHLLNPTQNTHGNKQFSVLLLLLDLLKSCIYLQPMVANEIIAGKDNNSALMDHLEVKLHVTKTSTLSEILLAEACAGVVYQLWKSCREHCYGSDMFSMKFHPCDEIVSNLASGGMIYKKIIAILLKYQELLGDGSPKFTNDMDVDTSEKPSITYKRSKLMRMFASSIEIIMIELMLHLRNIKGFQLPDTIKDLLVKISSQELLRNWFQLISCDSILSQVHANNVLTEVLPSSNRSFSVNVLDCTSCAINITNEICESDSRGVIENIIRSSHVSSQLVESQVQLISSLSTCGEILHVYDQSTNESNSALEVLFNQVEQAVRLFSKATKNFTLALSLLPSSTHQNIISQAVRVSHSLMGYLIICFSSITTKSLDQSSRILGILDELLSPCECILENIRTNPELQLRSYVMLCTSLAIESVKKGNESLSHNERKKFIKSRLRCCRLACETLELLKNVDMATDSMLKDRDGIQQVHLLQTTIKCMTLLIPSSGEDLLESSLSTQAYRIDLTNTLRNCNAVPLIIFHLNAISGPTTAFGNLNMMGMHEKHIPYDMIAIILNLTSSLAESESVEMSQLLLDNHFINCLVTNPILLSTSKKWTSLPNMKSNLRGYTEKGQLGIPISGNSHDHNQLLDKTTDPLHDIWRYAVRTIASLARSTNTITSKGFMTPLLRESHTIAIIDFVRTFELNIDMLLQYFQQHAPPRSASLERNSVSEFGYNAAFLNEACDVLSLVSELCSEGHKSVFEAKAPHLYQKFSSYSMHVVISLSSFLGAIGTARELFCLLNSLNQIIDSDTDDAMLAIHQRFASHPLLAEGVSDGKHEAIRHALYANKHCVCVTKDEYELSQSQLKLKAGSHASSTNNLEQSFQNHVQNDFLLHIENIAGQCMFNALAILTKVHPASSSFVPFNEAEAERLRLSSIPRQGTIVAIRPRGNTHGSRVLEQLNTASKSFARVIDFDEIDKTFDVAYIEDNVSTSGNNSAIIERDIKLSRLAGMEDVSKRIHLFEYRPAPESISDASVEHNNIGSIGHLIQTLRWCRQHHILIHHGSTEVKSTSYHISERIVKCIAEAASILLGNEISLHLELQQSPSYETQSIHRQLFDLFDDEEENLTEQFDLTRDSNHDKDTTSTKGGKQVGELQRLIDVDIWKSIQKQLGHPLAAARVDKEKIRSSSEQAGSALGWRTSTTTLHNSRRSPFK